MKDRISLFACIYQTLRLARVFYCQGQAVPNSPNVKMDYIMFMQVDEGGMNLGLRFNHGSLVPLTILPTRKNHIRKYVENLDERVVKGLLITNKDTGEIIEDISYADSFIMS